MKRIAPHLLTLLLALAVLSCAIEENTNSTVAPIRPLAANNTGNSNQKTQSVAQKANTRPGNVRPSPSPTPMPAISPTTSNRPSNNSGQRTISTTGSTGDDYYINSKGVRVRRPVRSSTAPAGATARCRDGTYSFSQSRRGTCSHHGGVAEWL